MPEFQLSLAYSLFRLGEIGGERMNRYDLADSTVLPGVGDNLTPDPMFNPLPLILETRLLRPLEGFGLAEVQEIEWAPGELEARNAFRKTPLYDRFLSFGLRHVANEQSPPIRVDRGALKKGLAAPYSPTGWPRQYHPRSGS